MLWRNTLKDFYIKSVVFCGLKKSTKDKRDKNDRITCESGINASILLQKRIPIQIKKVNNFRGSTKVLRLAGKTLK